MIEFVDTYERSCDHWSEAGREEMEDFYELATVDYKYLAEAIDWKYWFEKIQKRIGSRSLQLLDVACGSGKFPMALNAHSDIKNALIKPVDYALLDPSNFSISEARQSLSSPFTPSTEYEMRLQELECSPGSFDIVWATHALYAIPHNELEPALKRMIHVIGNGGAGFIAHARAKSHYLEFYQHYLSGFRGGVGARYSSSEQIINMLKKIGVALEIKEISYTNTATKTKESVVERYLQRCLFDDTLSLNDMLANPVTGPYLDKCYNDGVWQFAQNVTMIFINTSGALAVE